VSTNIIFEDFIYLYYIYIFIAFYIFLT